MAASPFSSNPRSLAAVIDAVTEAEFQGRRLPKAQRRLAARLIASRLGGRGGYAGAFAETGRERAGVARVYTGENLRRTARRRHVMAEEACRALRVLGGREERVALAEADRRLGAHIAKVKARHRDEPRGTYCCPFCTVSVWRQVAVGGLRDFAPEVPAGLRQLRARRDGKGGWRGYPFYYLLCALQELDLPAARAELKYATPRCQRLLTVTASSPYASRRRELLARISSKRGQASTY